MIDLALNNLYLLGAALIVGVATGRWAFSSRKAPVRTESRPGKEDEPRT